MTTLAEAAYRHILHAILSGAIGPGDILQEAALGAGLGMSRTPVREALKRLETEGLAAPEGRFLRVRRLGAAEVEEIFLLRRALEPQGAAAALRLPAARLDAMEAEVRALIAAGPAVGAAVGERQVAVDDAFHELMAGATANRAVARTIAHLRRRTCMFDRAEVPGRFEAGCREHLAILAAIRAGDAARAADLMAEHLDLARDAVLARIRAFRPAAKTKETLRMTPE